MEIARHLKAIRVGGGALELESMEVQVQLTETKSVQDLTPKEHLEVHDTIAECMIYANHWVAKKIAEAFPNCALVRINMILISKVTCNIEDRDCACRAITMLSRRHHTNVQLTVNLGV